MHVPLRAFTGGLVWVTLLVVAATQLPTCTNAAIRQHRQQQRVNECYGYFCSNRSWQEGPTEKQGNRRCYAPGHKVCCQELPGVQAPSTQHYFQLHATPTEQHVQAQYSQSNIRTAFWAHAVELYAMLSC